MSLEARGATFWMDEDAQRYLDSLNLEAAYIGGLGGPGILVFRPNPSRTAVIEELLHLGQHRRAGWTDLLFSGEVARLETEAQEKLLDLGARLGWTEAEMAPIRGRLAGRRG